MGKKIAQLTKVIYHLHNKGDDQLDMQDMADTYEAEIEQLLRDAAGRINTFKSQLEAAREETAFQEAVAKVQLRYEQERLVRCGVAHTLRGRWRRLSSWRAAGVPVGLREL